MKIPGQDPVKVLEAHLLGAQGATEPPAGSADAPSSALADSVEISGKAKEIQRLTQNVAQLPDTRAGQVAAAQGVIEAGTYNVQGQKIGEKMLRSALLDRIL